MRLLTVIGVERIKALLRFLGKINALHAALGKLGACPGLEPGLNRCLARVFLALHWRPPHAQPSQPRRFHGVEQTGQLAGVGAFTACEY
jgi:hypothetical protein